MRPFDERLDLIKLKQKFDSGLAKKERENDVALFGSVIKSLEKIDHVCKVWQSKAIEAICKFCARQAAGFQVIGDDGRQTCAKLKDLQERTFCLRKISTEKQVKMHKSGLKFYVKRPN